jgi:hypothetical protein
VENRECIAKYLYDLIVAGKYQLTYLFVDSAYIRIKRSWWWREKVVVVESFQNNYFVFRGRRFRSDLAKKAFNIIETREREIQQQKNSLAIADMVKDLKLECKDD